MKTALLMLSVLLIAGGSNRSIAVAARYAHRRHIERVHGRHSRTRAAEAPPKPRPQAEPTPDRYREIQGALASKGYLKSPPSGAWDPETQEAMRKYQADNRFEATGRINSRSLIGLGLGGGSQEPH